MQDSGRLSGGAELRRAVNAIRDNPHDKLAEALRADATVRHIRDARTLGRLRSDLAAFRADQARRLAAPDEAAAGRQRRCAAFVDPRAATAGHGWQESLSARIPMRLLAELALSGGLFVALVMFWNTFGPSFVAALADQPVP